MVVISDTTTITNLIQIDLLYIVSELYGEILIPEAVYLELSQFEDHQQIIDSSNWIEVVKITESRILNELIEIIGLLGILMLSKKEGIIEMVKPHLEKLKNDIGFRISEKLYEYVLGEVGEL